MLSKLSHLLKFRPVQEVRKKNWDVFVENHCISFSGKYLATATEKSQINFEFFLLSYYLFCFSIFLSVEIKRVTN